MKKCRTRKKIFEFSICSYIGIRKIFRNGLHDTFFAEISLSVMVIEPSIYFHTDQLIAFRWSICTSQFFMLHQSNEDDCDGSNGKSATASVSAAQPRRGLQDQGHLPSGAKLCMMSTLGRKVIHLWGFMTLYLHL